MSADIVNPLLGRVTQYQLVWWGSDCTACGNAMPGEDRCDSCGSADTMVSLYTVEEVGGEGDDE